MIIILMKIDYYNNKSYYTWYSFMTYHNISSTNHKKTFPWPSDSSSPKQFTSRNHPFGFLCRTSDGGSRNVHHHLVFNFCRFYFVIVSTSDLRWVPNPILEFTLGWLRVSSIPLRRVKHICYRRICGYN